MEIHNTRPVADERQIGPHDRAAVMVNAGGCGRRGDEKAGMHVTPRDIRARVHCGLLRYASLLIYFVLNMHELHSGQISAQQQQQFACPTGYFVQHLGCVCGLRMSGH